MAALVPVILSGGSGTRIWPLSREHYPKQFLPLLSTHSPFQETILRIRALSGARAPVVVANEAHRFLVRDQLAELGVEGARILLEPIGRNTAPALALAARQVMADDSAALLLALPADHYIESTARFVQAVRHVLSTAARGALVVFGVAPTKPHTGYGYIHRGVPADTEGIWTVANFTEKPDVETATEYVRSGDYLWNSGMFLVRADVYLHELEAHAGDIARAVAKSTAILTPDDQFLRPDREVFSACRSESIDYAVMEHTRIGRVVELDAGWSDLGSWSSLMQAGAPARAANVTRGDVLLRDVSGSFIHSSSRLVTAVGLRDQVVVETADAVFVAPLARAEEVKQLVADLRCAGREVIEEHLRVQRPWGWDESLVRDGRVLVRRIRVKPAAGLPLQLHHQRVVHWAVVSGEAEVTRGQDVFTLREGDSTNIPVSTKHRLSNKSALPLEIVEVQSTANVGEDGSLQFEGRYRQVSG